VLPVCDLGPQAGLHLLSLAITAVDLARELPLLACQRVKAGVDDDFATRRGASGWSQVRSLVADRSLTYR
jgi:hypothetical protein